MKITQDALHRAILTYAEEEIASKSSGLGRFATYFLITSLANHPEKTVGVLLDNPIIKMTGVANSDGTISAEELYAAARAAMEKAVSITVAGITFTVPDVDQIYKIIQRG